MRRTKLYYNSFMRDHLLLADITLYINYRKHEMQNSRKLPTLLSTWLTSIER